MKEQAFDQTELSDEALARLVGSGDRGAEETLVRRFGRLVRVCARPFRRGCWDC